MEISCLSLGVQPVGAADWLAIGGEGTGPWLKGKYDNAPEILGTTELNYETIAALKPNLILDVRSSGDQERYDTLSAIAPVVGIPEGADNWLTDRDTQLEIIGQALGKTDEAKTQQEEIDKRISDIAVEHPGWADKTVAVVAKKRPPQAFRSAPSMPPTSRSTSSSPSSRRPPRRLIPAPNKARGFGVK
ncbi:ABC transporter substrate-binding protein [Corynebacterium sp. SA-MJD20WY100]|uniref:ABC transporter substrate-binding protein n=1 Tax=Corynebacterium sp. SA-MJD20WY100 TaxID=3142969 RepID=UPI003221C18C